ncbi:hypothetical protein AYL99_03825 [Fonsecaea erecta]|uniref:FAD dependent oxidoreductase domain-containing protein n=1 Tax=Fonsecaea erecta TaxID=1367422 RepID=A0A178ZPQ4_9EURO|nr:hypothetical protein AYL99_03825 [Fonsecaea erecta]OAP61622.1 hypothetical protein AYL99_03825 [Fonsecaea erecta]
MGDAGSPPPPAHSSSSPPAHPQPVRSGLPSAHPTASFWQTSFPNPLAHHRSTPELPAHADVVVVGTGISGTFAVDELLKKKRHIARTTATATVKDLDHDDDDDDDDTSLTVLALDARTLCSAATGRNGGHLQPVIHNAPAHIIDFELRNFHHVEALALSASTFRGGGDGHHGNGDGNGNGHNSDHDESTRSSPSSSSSWCDFRRLEGCLGFWNEEYFQDAKRDLAATATATATATDKNKNKNKNTPVDDYAGLARVVEDAEELGALGLRVRSGAVGAIVQSVAASLSPYKLCVGVWRRLLERFEEKGKSAGDGRNTAAGTEASGARLSRHSLNLQTDTPVTALERVDSNSNSSSSSRGYGYGWILHTPRGSVHAHTVIVATNAYTSHLLPEFAPLIRPVQAQMSALIPPPPAPARDLAGRHTMNNTNTNNQEARKLIPMSYGFMGVGAMDRVMSDYLVQNPYDNTRISHHQHQHHLGDEDDDREHEHEREHKTDGIGGSYDGGGHLMFGGGRHLALHHGEGVWDDDFVDQAVERYLRSLPERLNLDLNLELDTRDKDEAAAVSSSQKQTPLLAIAASWTGIIGHSADGRPWVGGAPDRAGVFVCAGYTGHGMTNAPLCGRAVARRALRALALKGLMMEEEEEEEGKETTAGDVDVDVDVPPEYLITQERIERVLQAYA